eukprot:1078175-Pelagomonas_calceolata.AAC.3
MMHSGCAAAHSNVLHQMSITRVGSFGSVWELPIEHARITSAFVTFMTGFRATWGGRVLVRRSLCGIVFLGSAWGTVGQDNNYWKFQAVGWPCVLDREKRRPDAITNAQKACSPWAWMVADTQGSHGRRMRGGSRRERERGTGAF